MKDFCAAVNNSTGKKISIDTLRQLIPNDEKRFEIKYSIVEVPLDNDDRRFTYNHKKRPFIVLTKIPSQKIYRGVFTTSNLASRLYTKTNLQKYKLIIGAEYDLPKKSLVEHKFFKRIPYKNVLEDYGMLGEKDTLKLIKYTCLSHSVNLDISKNMNVIDVGDVISIAKKNYFIYKVTDEAVEGINIEKVLDGIKFRENAEYFRCCGEIYFINYKDRLVLNNNDNLLLVDSFPSSTVEVVKEKKYLKERK